MKAVLFVLLSVLACAFGYPSVATYYCSLSNPGAQGSCFPGACGSSDTKGHGIVALNPQHYGGSSTCHYEGSSCGQCWYIVGPENWAVVTVTDCCAGYSDHPSCVTDPSDGSCDWCAHNDHWHFDLDYDSFNWICGSAGVNAGHCDLSYTATCNC